MNLYSLRQVRITFKVIAASPPSFLTHKHTPHPLKYYVFLFSSKAAFWLNPLAHVPNSSLSLEASRYERRNLLRPVVPSDNNNKERPPAPKQNRNTTIIVFECVLKTQRMRFCVCVSPVRLLSHLQAEISVCIITLFQLPVVSDYNFSLHFILDFYFF